jgi:hypothetical protein
MSAVIIQFVPRPNRRRHLSPSSARARSIFADDDLSMDHADTATCENVVSGSHVREDDERN